MSWHLHIVSKRTAHENTIKQRTIEYNQATVSIFCKH